MGLSQFDELGVDRALLLQTFSAESEENLSTAEHLVLELEADPFNEDIVQSLFRVAHTLKGDAWSLDLEDLSHLAHAVEDLLDSLRKGRLSVASPLVSLLLDAVDVLRRLLGALGGGASVAEEIVQAMLARLKKACDEPSSSPAAGASRGKPRAGAVMFRGPTRGLRVSLDRLDQLLDLTSEIAIARSRITNLVESQERDWAEVVAAERQTDQLHAELRALVMNMRLLHVAPLFRQHLRTVRDLALSQGKQARLCIEGEDIEVDMTVVEQLRDPLNHMIRNAVDHGIEPPLVRSQNGKDPCGRIVVRASYDAGGVLIEVEDDGAGMKRELIKGKAQEMGLITNKARLDDAEVLRLIFEAGFSTTDEVTDISGRGMGMDIVERAIEGLRGTVDVESREGHGTRFIIRLPLTVAIIDSFTVGVGEEVFIIPMDAVTECTELSEEERTRFRGQAIVQLRGKSLPVLRLRDLFLVPGPPSTRESVVVVEHGGGRVGLAVDALLGESQTVIKPLGKMFDKVQGITGSSVIGTGRLALVLDVPGLMRAVNSKGAQP